ncbi:MAG: glycoside hydrolase family 172 protein [Fimbriimonadaceae bacterium]
MDPTTSLGSLPLLRSYRSRRASSYDRSGNNNDWYTLAPGEERVLMEEDAPGCIKHIWMTVGCGTPWFLRGLVLKIWWDGEPEPSVFVPLGDFFGCGFGRHKNFVSAPVQMSPEDGRGLNCWWHMPFDAAKIAVANECPDSANLYFYIDYESYERPHRPDVARLHAQYRYEKVTEGWLFEKLTAENVEEVWRRRPNLDGKENYVILDAEGDGVYVGCVLNVDCFQRQGNDWYGEGDDMIFVDGEVWPPSLHGTGTEDYFNTAFGPTQEYCAPYHGITVNSGNPDWRWKGKNSVYRWHIEDPIRFRKSIRVTIEHGHANKLFNDYSSMAVWYQLEPHKPFGLGPLEDRIPRPNEPEFPPVGN